MSLTILGAVLIILGILALLSPGLVGISALMVLGILVLTGGIIRFFWVFQAGSLGKGILSFSLSVLTILCGIALLAHPIFASGVLTVFLAGYFLLDGVSEIAGGLRIGTEDGGGWLFFAGIISILLGVLLWTQFPLSGIFAIGILLGIKLIFMGIIMVMGGTAFHRIAPA